MKLQTGYLHSVLDPAVTPKVVKTLIKLIKSKKVGFDTIAFRGMSGALIAPVVAAKLKKQLLMIRKDGDNSHGRKIEGNIELDKYIIIDDLIDTGKTIESILEIIKSDVKTGAECVGIFLYNTVKESMTRAFYPKGAKIKIPVYTFLFNGRTLERYEGRPQDHEIIVASMESKV